MLFKRIFLLINLSKRNLSCSKFDQPRLQTMKLENDAIKSILTENLVRLTDLFKRRGYEIRIAGGAVRDILLGIVPKDVDFATTALPSEMKTMFTEEGIRMINMKGEKHGTITARLDNENFEVTTLRVDVVTDGRHAEVQFTNDWSVDASRRDLTVNSMYLEVDGTLYDYFNGREDLEKRRIVFVGDPVKRIQEDYLRILRYFRFFGRLANDDTGHDRATLDAIRDNARGLSQVSGERIWVELSKILEGRFVPEMMRLIEELGVCNSIGLPKNLNIGELTCIYERAKSLKLQPVTVLVAGLRTSEEMLTFHERCKLSAFQRDLGFFLVKYRAVESTMKDYQKLVLSPGLKLKSSDVRLFIIELLKYRTELERLDQFSSWEPPRFPLSAVRLKSFGVPKGKPYGLIIEALKEAWIESEYKKTEDDLAELVPSVMKRLKIEERKN